MRLFKPKALLVVVKDIATSIHRASCNSATAIGIVDAFVRIDPPGFDLDSLVSRLSRDAFRLREERYPDNELAEQIQMLGPLSRDDAVCWSIYAYLFAMLPVLVESPRVGGTRWSVEEYQQLEVACFSRWCDARGEGNDRHIMCGYDRMRDATRSWLRHRSKLATANQECILRVVDEIERSVGPQQGAVRAKGFQYAVETFVGALYCAFKSDLAQYWLTAGGLGFFASDPAPLPPHLDNGSGSS